MFWLQSCKRLVLQSQVLGEVGAACFVRERAGVCHDVDEALSESDRGGLSPLM